MKATSEQLARLAAITVCFNPDIERLGQQLANLPQEVRLVVVDNASDKECADAIQKTLSTRKNAVLIKNCRNVGLAAALNQGAEYAMKQESPASQLILLDQDSVPEPDAIAVLLGAYLHLQVNTPNLGCVGPRLIDATTGLQHGFHCIRGWRWTRIYPMEDDAPVFCANMNGSGTLVGAEFFKELGGLDSSLFIDHVDTDWSFRVLHSKHTLFGIPQATFDHSMGERGLRFWFGRWRVWPQRSPRRHYFLFRNALWLIKRHYVPFVWKAWCLIKLALTFVVHSTIDPLRRQQIANMLEGICAGLRGRSRSIACRRQEREKDLP